MPVNGPTSTEEEPILLMWGTADVVIVVLLTVVLTVARGVVEAVKLLT